MYLFKKNQILELLKEGKRIDGRALDEVRELTIDVGVIPKAEGSARVRLGDTEVVGVFSDVEDSNILTHSKNYNVLGKFLDPGNKISTIT